MAVSERRFRVMASEAHVIVVLGPDTPSGDELIDDACAHLDHLERRWSRFLPDSDVSRINLSGGRPVPVDPSTITLFETMLEAWRLTDGWFDPTTLPALVASGYAASKDDPERVTVLPAGAVRGGGLADIGIDADRQTIAAPAEVVVDPGGLGKGLAADLTVARLLAAGASGALVSIGGDVAMAGNPPDPAGWRIAVEHPEPDRGEVCTLAVSGGGIATSSTRSRRWIVDGRSRHHLIDPVTGTQSTTDLAAVTVIAPCGWLAEAHATAALLAGRSGVLAHLDAHHLTGLAVDDAGGTVSTADLDLTGSAPSEEVA